jgi:bidirectional [NiFe] hydrogenase diaphorase subunit
MFGIDYQSCYKEIKMKTIRLEIDGKQIEAKEGSTILEVARENGINIPTLCNHPELEPSGVCRLCMVEISKNKRTKLVASCVYPVEENLVVKTDTEKIKKIRRMIVELLWPTVPGLAKELGVEKSRFVPENTECCLCGLCVQYCANVKKLGAVYFKGRGINRQPAILPELADECAYCTKCHSLCPGGWIVMQDTITNRSQCLPG